MHDAYDDQQRPVTRSENRGVPIVQSLAQSLAQVRLQIDADCLRLLNNFCLCSLPNDLSKAAVNVAKQYLCSSEINRIASKARPRSEIIK